MTVDRTGENSGLTADEIKLHATFMHMLKARGLTAIMFIDDGKERLITSNFEFDAGTLRIVNSAVDTIRAEIV